MFDGWHLDDPQERWPYAKQVGETFQSFSGTTKRFYVWTVAENSELSATGL
ncbi:MAG: hypothetical protein HC877_04250 [Thioploca sp.]|nr:hypothetical protein [Thioploca sp.]